MLAPLGELKFVDVNFPGQLPLSTEIEKAIQNTVLKQIERQGDAGAPDDPAVFDQDRWNLYAWSLNFSDDAVTLGAGPVWRGPVHRHGRIDDDDRGLLGAFAWAYYRSERRTTPAWMSAGKSTSAQVRQHCHRRLAALAVGCARTTREDGWKSANWTSGPTRDPARTLSSLFSGGVAAARSGPWISEGSQQHSYWISGAVQRANLPPVLVYVMMWGPPAADKDHYPTTLAASLGYTLDGPISQSFPGDRLPQDLGDEQRAEGIRSLPWKRYRPNQPWPTLLQSISPDEQLLRFGISEEVIRRCMADLAINEDWQSVSLDKLELYVSVRSRDQGIQILTPVTEVTLPEDKAKNRRYGAIRLHG